MHWIERQHAVVNVGRALKELGWDILGFDPGESDPMTDYFRPAHWHGVAVRADLPGIAILVDANYYRDHYSGKNGVPKLPELPKGTTIAIVQDGRIAFRGKGLKACAHYGDRGMEAARKLAKDLDSKAREIHAGKNGKADNGQAGPVKVVHVRDWTWIYFDRKPSGEVREALKGTLGARWSRRRKAWYIQHHVAEDAIHAVLKSAGMHGGWA